MSISLPQPRDPFEWVQAPWGVVLRCRPLAAIADHFFTAADVRLRDDQQEWNAVAAYAGVPPADLQLLHQVHGRTIVRADRQSVRRGRPEADGVISGDPAVAIAVRVADCTPLLMADRRSGAVAAVHAGWRSTMARIAAAGVEAMRDAFGTRPEDLVVAIGPSLGACCGEMGEEVVEAFRSAGHDERAIERWFARLPGRRPHFDLWRANQEQLEAAGVPAETIYAAGLCTRTHPRALHSYRAHGGDAGRMAGVIRARTPLGA